MAVILLRHTRPIGSGGLCYGRTDLPPGPDLPRQARRLAAQLPPLARVVTSPLARCARLAERLAAARGLPLAADPRLVELDFGAWEGRRWDAIPRAEIDAWAADLLHARPHGGETVAELAARTAAALADHGAPGTLVVTHMGVIRAALHRAALHRAGMPDLAPDRGPDRGLDPRSDRGPDRGPDPWPDPWAARVAFADWVALPAG